MDSDRVKIKPGHRTEDPEKMDMWTILTSIPRVALRAVVLAAVLAAGARSSAQDDEGAAPPAPVGPGQQAPAVAPAGVDDDEHPTAEPEHAAEPGGQEAPSAEPTHADEDDEPRLPSERPRVDPELTPDELPTPPERSPSEKSAPPAAGPETDAHPPATAPEAEPDTPPAPPQPEEPAPAPQEEPPPAPQEAPAPAPQEEPAPAPQEEPAQADAADAEPPDTKRPAAEEPVAEPPAEKSAPALAPGAKAEPAEKEPAAPPAGKKKVEGGTAKDATPDKSGSEPPPPVVTVPHAGERPAGAPAGKAAEAPEGPAGAGGAKAPGGEGGGGLLQKVARSLFGSKEPEAGAGATGEEESASAENRETQRKAKELVQLALRNIEKKRIAEAKKNLNDLITLKPYEADYHLALGLCFRQEKRYKDAQKKYQDVLDLGGPRSLVNLLLAECAADAGDKEKVFELLKEAAVGGRNIIHDVQNLPLLEKYKGDTEFIKLALYLEKFEIKSKKTHDPFTNPFPASVPANLLPKGASVAPTVTSINPQEQETMLNDARRTYEKVLWYIKLQDEQKAMENYIHLREIIEKRDLITLPKIANDFRILMGRMESLESQIEGIRLNYYWTQAQGRLKEMKEAFLATEYSKIDSVYGDLEKLAKDMEKANPHFKPVADRILTAGKVWQSRANVRREFDSAKPDIQGVVIAYDAKLAIIDNRVFKQGESFGDFHIQKVENNRVTFRYKGEEIPLIFRRY